MLTSFNIVSCKDIVQNYECFVDEPIGITGKISKRRAIGGFAFFSLSEENGDELGVYMKKDGLGARAFDRYMDFSVGEEVIVAGNVFKTERGEIMMSLLLMAPFVRHMKQFENVADDVAVAFFEHNKPAQNNYAQANYESENYRTAKLIYKLIENGRSLRDIEEIGKYLAGLALNLKI